MEIPLSVELQLFQLAVIRTVRPEQTRKLSQIINNAFINFEHHRIDTAIWLSASLPMTRTKFAHFTAADKKSKTNYVIETMLQNNFTDAVSDPKRKTPSLHKRTKFLWGFSEILKLMRTTRKELTPPSYEEFWT